MQDQPIKFVTPQGGILVREQAPAGQLPPEFTEQIAISEAVILVQRTPEGGLRLRPVIPGGIYSPDTEASHALVKAITDDLPQLVKRVSGYPTHAERYLAFQTFALIEQSDPERFERVNAMLRDFEEEHLKGAAKQTRDYMDRVADFMVYAIEETEPALVAPTTAPN
jgi:hypothetical protein